MEKQHLIKLSILVLITNFIATSLLLVFWFSPLSIEYKIHHGYDNPDYALLLQAADQIDRQQPRNITRSILLRINVVQRENKTVDEAIRIFQKQNAEDYNAYLSIAFIYNARGDNDKAIYYVNEARKLIANSKDGHGHPSDAYLNDIIEAYTKDKNQPKRQP